MTDFLFFLGKFLLTAGLVCASYPVFTRPVRLLDDSGSDVTLTYPWLPMIIVGIMTYIITTIFFSVYSVAVDTLFLCFCKFFHVFEGSHQISLKNVPVFPGFSINYYLISRPLNENSFLLGVMVMPPAFKSNADKVLLIVNYFLPQKNKMTVNEIL